MAEQRPLPPGIGNLTVTELLAKLSWLPQGALWVIVLLLVVKQSGCELPIEWKKPPTTPPGEKNAKVDVPNAIGRISIGNTGCTATICGPVKDTDKEIHILTAAHCCRVGQKGTMVLKDGRKFNFTVISRDEPSDAAWLTATRPEGVIPFAFLATTLPEKGSPVWHQGYGVDRPGNLEKGEFLGVSPDGRQCVFHLSVSSGDSGGGIIHTADGRVLSPVCCTSRLAGPGNVWGSTPANAAAIRPGRVITSDTSERVAPTITLPHPDWPEPPTL